MADETSQETGDAIHQALLADAHHKVDGSPPIISDEPHPMVSLEPGSVPVGWVAPPEPVPAAARIRAFEDEVFGTEAVRIDGRIERGSGSPFAAMSAETKRQYAALEKLVAAEQKLADAHAALIQAEVDHEAALAAAEPKPDAKPAE